MTSKSVAFSSCNGLLVILITRTQGASLTKTDDKIDEWHNIIQIHNIILQNTVSPT
jgi:hypothetical protein